jgi:hypothetical protein
MAGRLADDWLEGQLAGAPAQLVARTREFARRAGTSVTPASLVHAGQLALGAAVAGATDRGAALDLLAADALVTLALAAKVEAEPAALERFAVEVRLELGGGGEPAAE